MTLLLIIEILSLLGCSWLYASAPEGWEDEHGFHFGKEPRR